MAGSTRPQQHHLAWPLTSTQVEGMEDMFQTLFKRLRAVDEALSTSVLVTGGDFEDQRINQIVGRFPLVTVEDGAEGPQGVPGSQGLQGLPGLMGLPGQDGQDGDDASGALLPHNIINTGWTLGSVIFAGPSGVLTQNNSKLFYNNNTAGTGAFFGIGTNSPTRGLTVVGDGSHAATGYISLDNGALEAAMEFRTSGTTNWNIYRPGGSTDLRMADNLGSVDRIFFSQGGLVGIGATAAGGTVLFHVNGAVGIGTTAAGVAGTPLTVMGTGTPTTVIAVDTIHATARNQFQFFRGGTLYHSFGLSGAANDIVNGNVAGDWGWRLQARSFIISTDTGTTSDFNLHYNGSGNAALGLGLASPTAALHIKAGTATASTAPLKFTSGTSLTTAEAGAVEFTTDNLFFTITTGAARKLVVLSDSATAMTVGSVPFATTNGRLTENNSKLFWDNTNFRLGIGTASPTGRLHLPAGATGAGNAPLKFTSGTNLTTAEAGAMEYDGTDLFFTRAGTVRENVLVAIDNVAAPSTSIGAAIVNFYGSAATNFLGDPNRWLSVNVLGSTYKIPLYT